MYFHFVNGGKFVMFLGLSLVIMTMILWWRDVIREATFEGHHTKPVQRGLRYGMILFIVSEIMFFFAFFWAFFSF
jgi:heme/copper-type cytochrome/quinol oxidase subunit 3